MTVSTVRLFFFFLRRNVFPMKLGSKQRLLNVKLCWARAVTSLLQLARAQLKLEFLSHLRSKFSKNQKKKQPNKKQTKQNDTALNLAVCTNGNCDAWQRANFIDRETDVEHLDSTEALSPNQMEVSLKQRLCKRKENDEWFWKANDYENLWFLLCDVQGQVNKL